MMMRTGKKDAGMTMMVIDDGIMMAMLLAIMILIRVEDMEDSWCWSKVVVVKGGALDGEVG